MRGAWVEIFLRQVQQLLTEKSLPVRGAWVEIEPSSQVAAFNGVAPRAGSVG